MKKTALIMCLLGSNVIKADCPSRELPLYTMQSDAPIVYQPSEPRRINRNFSLFRSLEHEHDKSCIWLAQWTIFLCGSLSLGIAASIIDDIDIVS